MIHLYTTSPFKEMEQHIANKYVEEHPEYEAFVKCLCEYPVQKWAEKVRLRMRIDVSSLEEAIAEENEYFGIDINSTTTLLYQRQSLLFTKKVVHFFEEMLKADNLKELGLNDAQLRLVEDIFGEVHDSSVYYVKKELGNTLECFCKKYNKTFLKEYKEMKKITNSIDPEILVAFHDTEVFLKLAGELGYYIRRRITDVDTRDVHFIMEKTIEATQSYPFSENIYTPLISIFHGKNFHQISMLMCRHNDYIQKRYREGIEALSIIFWGCLRP